MSKHTGDTIRPCFLDAAIAVSHEGTLAQGFASRQDGALTVDRGGGVVCEDPVGDAAVAGEGDGEEVFLALEIVRDGEAVAPFGLVVEPGSGAFLRGGIGEDDGGGGRGWEG